jgi:hypothetical protein
MKTPSMNPPGTSAPIAGPSGIMLQLIERHDDAVVFRLNVPMRVIDDLNHDIWHDVKPMMRDVWALQNEPIVPVEAMRPGDI